MTNKEAIDSAAVRLNLNNIENSLYDSKQMFMEASGMSTTDYLMHMTDDISNEVHEKFEKMDCTCGSNGNDSNAAHRMRKL